MLEKIRNRFDRCGILLIVCWILVRITVVAQADDRAADQKTIDTSGFSDSAAHWRNLRDSARFLQPRPDHPAWEPHQSEQIAENILLFQRDNGGWPKDYDMRAVLNDTERSQVVGTRSRNDTSFDNHNIFSQVEYLARIYRRTLNPRYRESCERGLDFMLSAQYPSGGIPQKYPLTKGYRAHITFNDGVMIGVLRTLKNAAERASHFDWLDDVRRDRAAVAVARGVDCILKCQILVDGKRTGWCQQHDETTFDPTSARSFELASICPQDTTEIVLFLKSIEPASEVISHSIDAAVSWLRTVVLQGIRLEKVAAPKLDYLRHTADFDVIVVSDPAAPPLWARHYEIGTNRPIFAGRDGIKRYRFSEMERERRTGTSWYGGWPQSLLDQLDQEQPDH